MNKACKEGFQVFCLLLVEAINSKSTLQPGEGASSEESLETVEAINSKSTLQPGEGASSEESLETPQLVRTCVIWFLISQRGWYTHPVAYQL